VQPTAEPKVLTRRGLAIRPSALRHDANQAPRGLGGHVVAGA